MAPSLCVQAPLITDAKECSSFGTGTAMAVQNQPMRNLACILAMATATPPHCVDQRTYPDFYFDVTNSAHKLELKQKFARICERSGIDTRFSLLSEDFLRDHPEFYTPEKPSLEERLAIFEEEVPKLAHQAAVKAIEQWGRPAAQITHLIVTTLTGVAIPGADVSLVKSLGLSANVNRIMLYMLGCYAGVSALRIAKDIAESNPHARILICCSELSAPTFRAPDERFTYSLVASALFGDGASAVIVGSLMGPKANLSCVNPDPSLEIASNGDHKAKHKLASCVNPDPSLEIASNGDHKAKHKLASIISGCHNGRQNEIGAVNYGNGNGDLDAQDFSDAEEDAQDGSPSISTAASSDSGCNPTVEKAIYEIHWAGETLAPDTEGIIKGKLQLDGLQFYLDRALPSIVAKHVGPFCRRALAQAGRRQGKESGLGLGFNDVFWAVHAGGPAILSAVEAAMGLEEGKLEASRAVLRRYGNVSASTVLFALQELAAAAAAAQDEDASEEWGLAVAFGPGVTIEGALLRRP